jgi:hypothetical protein
MKISSTSWWKNRGRMQCIGCRKWMDADDPDLVTIKVRVGEGLIGDMTAPSKWDFCSECWYEFQRVFFANGTRTKAGIMLPPRGRLRKKEYN